MTHRTIHLDTEEIERVGGWFCYGECRQFTELDCDREMNVCARCGRPTVKYLPKAKLGPETSKPEDVLEEQPVGVRHRMLREQLRRERRQAVSVERAHGFFAAMKEGLE